MIRFKIDENLHPSLAEFLRTRGHDAETVVQEGLRGCTDARLIEVCKAEERVLVTLDVDFADIRTYPAEKHHGLIVLRVKDQGCANVQAVMDRVLATIQGDGIAGELWVVDERNIRVRERVDRS